MSELTQCPNPLHTWRIGLLLIGAQIAQDYWAVLDSSGNRIRRWFSIETVKDSQSDNTLLNLVVLRLTLSFGWMRKGETP